MKRPDIAPGPWTLNKAVDSQNCGFRVSTPNSPPLGAVHVYSETPNKHEIAQAIAALPDLLEALECLAVHTHAMTLGGFPLAKRKELARSMNEKIKATLTKAGYTF